MDPALARKIRRDRGFISWYLSGGTSGGSAAAFDPLSSITWKAAFWADDPSWSNPGNGATVSSWRDAGTENKAAAQSTGAQRPTFRSAPTGFNGHAAVQFSESGSTSLVTPSWGASLAAAATWVAVLKFGNTAGSRILNGLGDGSTWLGTTDGNVHHLERSTTTAEGGTPNTNLFLAYAQTRYGTGTAYYEINGTQVASSATSDAAPMTGLIIGRNTAQTRYLDGHLAFLGIYDGVLSGTSKDALEAWATSYYGLTIS